VLTKITVESCLVEIRKIWQKLPESRQPWGVWITYHEPIPENADRADTNVIAAWFLSENGICQENVWAYIRFRTVQSGKYWCHTVSGSEASPLFGGVHQKYEIGLASFALLQETSFVYLDYVWGGTYGLGSLYRINPMGDLTFDSRIWIS
jgi:hypothetical protein